tara:strand:- start:269 stop:943 length:675 start_codon:yes stop_codon:yes gene_type:complete
MATIKCLVVDDEELARTLMATYIEKLEFLELVGTAENPLEAMKIMNEQQIDLLFLDIQMPELKGTVFAKTVNADTKIIFTTAYSEYALEGYELNALDYLLKPITFERFIAAVNKFGSVTVKEVEASMIIKSGYDLHKVKFADIRYIESDSEYVNYFTTGKKIMSNQSLKALENLLPKSMFIRVHRSYIINKTYVTGLKGRDLILSEELIPVSDSYYDAVKLELF